MFLRGARPFQTQARVYQGKEKALVGTFFSLSGDARPAKASIYRAYFKKEQSKKHNAIYKNELSGHKLHIKDG